LNFVLAAGGLDLLKVNPGLVIWTLITFLIVVFILKAFAWQPILDALDERSATIESDIKKANDMRVESEALLAKYQDSVNSAKDEAIAIINEAKSDAANLRNKMQGETQQELKSMKEQAMRDIELAKAQAVKDLRGHVVEMSVEIAAQILQKQLKKEDLSAFAEQEIDKLKSLNV